MYKINKKNQWTAVSVRGYAGTIEQIGKGGVLGTTELSNLQNTPLYDELKYITTNFKNFCRKFILLFQKEVADRIIANDNSNK